MGRPCRAGRDRGWGGPGELPSLRPSAWRTRGGPVMPNIAPTAPAWPDSLANLCDHPARLVYDGDLSRLRIIASYSGLKKLPPPIRLPGRRMVWLACDILDCLGLGPDGRPVVAPESAGALSGD